MSSYSWSLPFFSEGEPQRGQRRFALIILNQPFAFELFRRLWDSSEWHCCADGGANRLHDACMQQGGQDLRSRYLPNMIKGDLDSLRSDVREYYTSQGVLVVRDDDQNSTDLMKCIYELSAIEKQEGDNSYELIVLGGLSGRLDQTIHTLSLLYKQRKTGRRIYAVNDENVAWVLDKGEHLIDIDHTLFGQTCGLLPVGVDSSVLTTTGLRWNLTEHESGFEGMVSTSNHLVPEEPIVYIKTSRAIWWTMELRI
ncbi:thiamine pyrophosphokinase [Cristinia sonorae]|uniref:Thiamine pyrophosphokinase n=1 Tax=Cristinia sonorae TaxID=1940300 RepID=A0A8K0UM55_9AGAR|nr:thiamine pyrophosphokinase [Cristinia sonorae]